MSRWRKQSPDRGAWSVSLGWTAVAVALVGALVWWVPSGALLLLFLGVVISAHEAGHLLVGRRVGMRPTEYFWGFGPEIVAYQRGGCRYGLRLLFVGGYVKIHGMTPSSVVPEGFGEGGTFRAARARDRLATILAGPGVNLAMAVLAFGLAALVEGQGPAAALSAAFGDLWFVASGTVEALGLWVSNLGDYFRSVADPTGQTAAPVRFMSPVAQAEVSALAVAGGVVSTLRWFAILSAAVGIINLLPLPPLDGAHALVAMLDGVLARVRPSARQRLDVSRAVPVAYVTVIALVVLSLSALVLDLRDVI
ncbi:MAG: site-2 protease family protein [Actinomycetota bacterium]